LTGFNMGLPANALPSAAFAATTVAHGTVTGSGTAAESGHVEAVVGTTNLKIEFMAYVAANHKISVNGSYRTA
jgi:phage tail sheath gpL-like